MSAQEAMAFVVAQAPPPSGDPGGQGEDFGKSSPLGLVLLILFAIAVALLVRSMTKHLKKLPTAFDQAKATAAAPARVKRAAAEAAEADGEAEHDGEAAGGGAQRDGAGGEREAREPGEAKRENGNAPTA